MQSYRFRAVVKEEPESPSGTGANTIWKCCDIQVFAARELLNNGVEKGLIGHGRQVAYLPVPMAPGTEPSRQTVRVDGHHIGHLIHQPFWRSGCRSAEDNRKLSLGREIQDLSHPLEPIFSRVRFESAPGKLADAHKTNPDITHCIEVDGPSFGCPMFRIITDTERSRRTRLRAWLHCYTSLTCQPVIQREQRRPHMQGSPRDLGAFGFLKDPEPVV